MCVEGVCVYMEIHMRICGYACAECGGMGVVEWAWWNGCGIFMHAWLSGNCIPGRRSCSQWEYRKLLQNLQLHHQGEFRQVSVSA